MIHIASTYTADPLNFTLNTILQKFCNQHVCFHYHQIFQQALLTNSEFNENKNGLNVLLIRSVDLFLQKKEKNGNLNDLADALNRLQHTMRVPLLIILTPTQTSTIKDKQYYSTLESNLKAAIDPNTNTVFVSSEEIQILSNTPFIFDHLAEKYGHIPYTMDFYHVLAMFIARKYSLLIRKPYKVIVLDCDGTLWNGVAEEDGIAGLVIHDDHLSLQRFMLDLYQAGFLLCLCSKNGETSVLNVFKERKEMVLDISKHICSYRINWLPKSTNIQSLAEELDLSLDAFIFIDDNPVECAEVKAALPDVLVIHLSYEKSEQEELTYGLDFLKNIWAFDTKNKSFEDEKRTQFYQQNRMRKELKSNSSSVFNFIKKLKIKTNIYNATPEDLERIIQLSQRTNQFNLFPNAISDIEFNQRITQQKPSSCLAIKVSDKYGDYGLVGVVVYDIKNEELIVRNFFLSCRILGREIEYKIMDHLAEIAEKNRKSSIKILFEISDRNIPGIAFVKHLSEGVDLKKTDHIILLLTDLKKIKPNIFSMPQESKKNTHHKTQTSNDYMIGLAQHSTQPKRENMEGLTVEERLSDLLMEYKLWVHMKKEVSFVELGIDSLACVLIASSIHQRFHIEIAPFELLKPSFTFHTLTQYVLNKIKNSSFEKNDLSVFGVHETGLSLTQMQLWEEEQIFTGTSRNNMFSAYQIEGNVNAHLMEKTFLQLMARHDSLRFSFMENNKAPLLTLNALDSIHFKISIFPSDNDKDIQQYTTHFRREPFDLSQAPLFRVAMIRRNETKTILLFCIHHIIHDGWSLNILLGELSEIYNAYSKQIPLPTMRHSLSYVHFIQWQQRHVSNALLEEQVTFWKKQVDHMPRLELVYDRTRKQKNEKQRNHRISFKMNAKTTHELKQLSVIHQVTLYHVLTSAFGVFLSHYADQNDINFLTAVSGRHQPHVANMVGLLTKLVLIRMKIDDQSLFSDLIKKTKKTMDLVFNHLDLPFNEIIQLTGESVNSKMHAYNQAGFIFQNYPINHLKMNDKICKRVFADDKAELIYDVCDECRFGNMVCFMQEYESELHGVFEYNTTLFNKKRVKCMIDSFKTLLQSIGAVQNGPARSLPLVSAHQQRLFLYEWNQPKVNASSDLSVLHCFSEQVMANEGALAVTHHKSHLTYGELDKISNQLARKLRKEGVDHEMPVGIFLENKMTRIVAMLGILKAGGCYVPFEMDMPTSRMNHILRDANILFVVTDAGTGFQMINAHYPTIKSIVVTDQTIEAESKDPLLDTTRSNQLAYVMYTSGSTGNPKGIEIEQRGILRLVKSPDYIDISPSDRIAQASSFLFDAATFEIWGALLNGATLVMMDKSTLLDATSLKATIDAEKITILFLTTPLFHALTETEPHLFQNLNYLLVGGDIISYESVERIFSEKNKPRCFIHCYGPTENTTFSTTYSIKKRRDLSDPISIGKPVNGTQIYVLDSALNPSPIGAPGQLYVGGEGLARRYIHQEKLNQERFIYHLNERLYNTGDMVAWTVDGNLNYIGRKDNQIKMNGYLVELEEVEVQLETHPLVNQAIVLVKNKHHHRQLVAFILLKPGVMLENVNLYHHLKCILPQYMLPKFYYQMDELPITANGKVNKKALLEKSMPAIGYTEYAPPTSILHEQLISIYAGLLHLPPSEISINTEFFDLGGNSISAIHLIAKVNQQFNVRINFSDIYECANVKSLSEKIADLLGSVDNSTFEVPRPATCSRDPEISRSALDYTAINDDTLKVVNAGHQQKTPIVFIHPIGGTGFCYFDLIKSLPSDQPCYILQDPSIDADKILFEDMSTMAAYYNHLLLKKLKERKFILAGYSFGGMLSLEMVSQLEHQALDGHICLVVAFDTWVVSHLLNAEAKETLRQSMMKQYTRVANELVKEHIDPKPWMELHYHRLQNVGFDYIPPIINKKIVLFKANQPDVDFSAMNDATNYLSAHTRQKMDVYVVSGNHHSILQHPHVNQIGYLLNQYLKDNML